MKEVCCDVMFRRGRLDEASRGGRNFDAQIDRGVVLIVVRGHGGSRG